MDVQVVGPKHPVVEVEPIPAVEVEEVHITTQTTMVETVEVVL